MAREIIKLPNNKWGFLILLIIEALLAIWALAATFYAIRADHTRTVLYGGITLFALFYIMGRSFRTYRDLLRREREGKRRGGEKDK